MVAFPVPEAGDMVHQAWLLDAVQAQVVDAAKVVDPAADATVRAAGVTDNAQGACVTVI